MSTVERQCTPRPPRSDGYRRRWYGRVIGAALVLGLGSAAASSTGASPAPVQLSEASTNQIVTVAPGTPLTLTLHSTYWSLIPLAHQSSIALVGPVLTVGLRMVHGSPCVPGQGCGTVRAHFRAQAAGRVQLRATRTTCGEALRCSPAQRVWTVTIRVR